MRDITVHVEFVNEHTGGAFAQTHMPLSMLPQSFDTTTHIEMNGQQWEVLAADPSTADGFAQSRQLVLTVRQVQVALANPAEILYSVATLCDVIPPLMARTHKRHKRVFELHEDDWRQIELVSQDYHDALDAELRDIRAISEQTPAGQGFRRLHLRQRITTPLRLPVSTVVPTFSGARPFDGLAYLQTEGLIAGGFALDMGDGVLYGEQRQETVTTLCLAGTLTRRQADAWGKHLTRLMETHRLFLVDWCRCAAFDAEALGRLWSRERDV